MTKILIEIDTDTQRVVQIATQEERSYSEDEKHENGNYFNTCYHCGRTFVDHKRRAVCKVCAAAPQPEPVDAEPVCWQIDFQDKEDCPVITWDRWSMKAYADTGAKVTALYAFPVAVSQGEQK